MRLITFGDSYTQGIGLDGLDHWAHNNYSGTVKSMLNIKSASPDAWPHLLADHLGRECVNLGRGGSSTKYVFQMIKEFDFEETDLVVIQWPGGPRNVIWKDCEDGDSEYIPLCEIAPYYKEAENYYKNYYTEFDSNYNTAIYIECIHAYLKDKGVQVYHISDNMSWNPDIVSDEGSALNAIEKELLTKTFPILKEVGQFFANPLFQGFFADMCNDGHHGPSYHIGFAKYMAERIQTTKY